MGWLVAMTTGFLLQAQNGDLGDSGLTPFWSKITPFLLEM